MFFLCPGELFVFAAEPPPGASAEVLSRKDRQKAEREVLELPAFEEPEIEEEPTPADDGQPQARFQLARVVLEGGEEIVSSEEIGPLLRGLEGREVTFRQLQGLQKKIEKFYRAKGYMAAAYLPPQKVEAGEVRMRVVIYKMGEVYVEGLKHSRLRKILSFWKIKKNEKIRYDRVRSSLVNMNQNPDREVRSYLKAAKEAGVVDVYLKVEDHFPVHAGYGFDNQGVRLTGKLRHNFNVRHNNLLGLDDIFLIGTSFGHSFGAVFLQHLIPVNSRGTRFLWGFSHAQVDPQKEFAPFGVNSTSETYSLSVRQHLFTRRFFGDLYISYDFLEKSTKQLSTTSLWDKLRVLAFGGIFQWADAFGVWQMGQDFFFGLPVRGDGFPLTTRGGESSFFKYGFSLEREQPLFRGTSLYMKLEGQLTPDKLTPSQQIFMGGMDSVRGYPENDYGADNGILVRTEYRVPAFFFPRGWSLPRDERPLRQAVKLVSFIDYGYGSLRRPGVEEHDNRQLMGAGGGFAMQFRKNISAGVYWGARLLDRGLTEGDGPSQFHFRLDCDL